MNQYNRSEYIEKLNNAISKGKSAEQMAENEHFSNLFNYLKLNTIEALQGCDTSSVKEMRSLTIKLQIVGEIEQYFESFIENGELALAQLEDLNKQSGDRSIN